MIINNYDIFIEYSVMKMENKVRRIEKRLNEILYKNRRIWKFRKIAKETIK